MHNNDILNYSRDFCSNLDGCADHLLTGSESYVNCAFIHSDVPFVCLSTNPSFMVSICWVDELISAWISELYRGQGLSPTRSLSLPFTLSLSLSLSVSPNPFTLASALRCYHPSPPPNSPSTLSSVLAFLSLT